MLHFYIVLHFLSFCFGLKKDEGWNYINLHCRNNDNEPTDWWYMYKPAGDAAPYDDSGRNFSFITSEILGRWIKSNRHITINNMLYHTLAPMYRGTYVDRVAYMVYEDAEPDEESQGAMARGILMADEIGGIFISHTVPNLVDPKSFDRPKFPESELINGHLILCISMDMDTLNELAVMLRHVGSKIIALQIPQKMEPVVPNWVDINVDDDKHKGPESPLDFFSKQSGVHGFMYLRRPGQNVCLYRTFARKQGVVLDVYSPGNKIQKNSCNGNCGVRTINSISLKIHDEPVHYVNSRTDKTRFAVSTAAHWQKRGRSSAQLYWTCTSSLVRDDDSGQGGLLLCVDLYYVWNAFDNLKIKEPEC